MEEQKVTPKRNILSFQQFSIFANGGGARILRRLIEGNTENVQFLSVVNEKTNKTESAYKETQHVLFPHQKKWMRSFIRNMHIFSRDKIFYRFNERMIRKSVSKLDFDTLHIVDHGKYSNALTQMALKRNIPIWISFHDHFNANGSLYANTSILWKSANKRMVISKEMGEKYCQLFGSERYLIVTDGLKELEISPAKLSAEPGKLTVYFAGLIHIAYYPLFKSFCGSLDRLALQEGIDITLILRGTQQLDFLEGCSFKIDYRGFTLDNDLLKQEMNDADLLYLPIKYDDQYFYKYSFSTKLVGYLGASGNIFYHGPVEAAAARFLENNSCGIICDSMDNDVILDKLKNSLGNYKYSREAKKVAYLDFLLKDKQKLFWS